MYRSNAHSLHIYTDTKREWLLSMASENGTFEFWRLKQLVKRFGKSETREQKKRICISRMKVLFTWKHCLFWKQFSSEGFRAQTKPELIHSDICEPMEVPSLGGPRYFVTFIVILQDTICIKSEEFKKYKSIQSRT